MKMQDEIFSNIEKLIASELLNRDNDIVLFGANKSSMEIKQKYSEYNYVAIIDNDIRKHGQLIEGLYVYSPDEYLKTFDENKRIIIASEYYKQMSEQLEEYGFEVGKQIFVVWYGRRFYDTSKETFDYHKEKAERGLAVLENLIGNSTKYQFICPYPGTGDIYLIGLFIKEYTKRKHIDEYQIVASSKVCKKVAAIFDIDTIIISQDDMNDLVVCKRMVDPDNIISKILNDGYMQGMTPKLRGYKNTDFRTMFQKAVFELDDYNDVDCNVSQTSADELFDIYKLKKGKTVLLSPYANTITHIPDEYWMKMVQVLKGKGYTVCTNSVGDNEPPIEGTEGIFIPYSQIIDFINKAGVFIGMRSGLCDIVSSTTAKMIVFYPVGNIFGACSTYDYFSLEKMRLKKDRIIEVEWNEKLTDLDIYI